MRRFWSFIGSLILLAGCGGPRPLPAPQSSPSLTPPMGWNSWNSGIPLTEQNIEQTIDAMVRSGMRDAGYRYVNLDAGWADATRDSAGDLRADPVRFPSGIAAVAQYAHDRGMLLGLYASPGYELCGIGRENASTGHEAVDAATFARWGVDYLKYDWCSTDTDRSDQVRAFTDMRDALRASGRHILYSINPNTSVDPDAGSAYDWSSIADMSRNTIDLVPLWHNDFSAQQAVIGVVDQVRVAAAVQARSRPGYWNDPDMLVAGISWPEFVADHPGMFASLALPGTVGPDQLNEALQSSSAASELAVLVGGQHPSLTADEQRSHVSLWAMLAAPMLAGNDVRSMPEATRTILTNPDIIAVDQDSLVIQGHQLPQDPRIIVKPLADGAVAVALLNPDQQPASIDTTAAAVGLPASACYPIRDLWAHTNRATTGDIRADGIPPHATAVLRVGPHCP